MNIKKSDFDRLSQMDMWNESHGFHSLTLTHLTISFFAPQMKNSAALQEFSSKLLICLVWFISFHCIFFYCLFMSFAILLLQVIAALCEGGSWSSIIHQTAQANIPAMRPPLMWNSRHVFIYLDFLLNYWWRLAFRNPERKQKTVWRCVLVGVTWQ